MTDIAVGVSVDVGDPAAFVELARVAENAGLESIWRGEHVMRPTEGFSGYPYGEGDHLSSYAILDPLQLATAAGVATERVRIGVGVLLVPLWDTWLLARSLRTAALACRGRLVLGVGVGWSRQEFEVLGRSFGTRGRDTDDRLVMLGDAMATGVVQAEGRRGKLFDQGAGEPETPGIELIVGGDSTAALRRAKRFGGGWYGHHDDTAMLRERLDSLDESLRVDPSGFTAGRRTIRVPGEVTRAQVSELAELGFERVIVPLVRSADAAGAIARIGAWL